MTITTITKTCDVCKKTMQKDGPIWYGGYVLIEENYATKNSYPNDKITVDVCRECMKIVRGVLKVPQFDYYLTPEEEEMVDRAVASMAREARHGN